MTDKLKEYKDSKMLSSPFDKKGEPTLTTSIVATLMLDKPLTKKNILTKLGYSLEGKSDGYLANHFAELSRCGIITFSKSELVLKRGINFQKYVNFIFLNLLKIDKAVSESLRYKLLPKNTSKAVDFINSPDDDVFSKPNPYLELPTPVGIKSYEKRAS